MRYELQGFRILAGERHASDRFRRRTHGDGQPFQVHRKGPPVEADGDSLREAELFKQRLGAHSIECR
jgi:hypothetical protein